LHAKRKKIIDFFILSISLFFVIKYLFLNYYSYINIDDRGYYSSFYDTGWFYHPIKNFLEGKGFTSQEFLYYKSTDNLFGVHSFYILYIFAMLDYIFNSPLVLFLSGPLIFGISLFYLFLLLKKKEVNNNILILIFAIIIFNPQINWSLWHGFYAVNIGAYLFIPLYYYYHINNFKRFIFFAVLIAISQEFLALTLAILLFIFFLNNKYAKKYLVLSLIFLFYFCMQFFYLIPKYSNFAINHEFTLFYGYLGDNLKEVIINFFLKFNRVIKVIFIREKIFYFFSLIGSFLFLPLSNKISVAALPLFCIGFFSMFPALYDIRVSYATPINVALFIAAVDTIIKYKTNFLLTQKKFLIPIILILFLNYYNYSPGLFSRQYNSIRNCSKINDYKIQAKKTIRKFNNLNFKSVCVSDKYSIYFTNYEILYSFPHFYDKAELLIIDKNLLRDAGEKKIIQELLANPKYLVDYEDSYFLVFTKR